MNKGDICLNKLYKGNICQNRSNKISKQMFVVPQKSYPQYSDRISNNCRLFVT